MRSKPSIFHAIFNVSTPFASHKAWAGIRKMRNSSWRRITLSPARHFGHSLKAALVVLLPGVVRCIQCDELWRWGLILCSCVWQLRVRTWAPSVCYRASRRRCTWVTSRWRGRARPGPRCRKTPPSTSTQSNPSCRSVSARCPREI